MGGFIEKEDNLSHDGDAQVYDDVQVYGNAWVSETHGDNKHALVYRAAAEAAKVHIDLEEDGNS